MAERPVFIPAPQAPGYVIQKSLRIAWAGGFAAVQKKKNIIALHDAAKAIGIGPVLEASTKSDEKIGQSLSAFNLRVKISEGDLPLECVYQGSKVFERGGPFTDLYFSDARSAKRDPRLHQVGGLVAFLLDGFEFPLEPKTFFYDWLYISALYPHREWLNRLSRYEAFSDIEFNPQKSINCQARSLALFVALRQLGLLDEAVRSPASFVEILQRPITRVKAVKPTGTMGYQEPANQAKAKFVADVSVKSSLTKANPELLLEFHENASPEAQSVNQEAVPANPMPYASTSDLKITPPNFESFLREKALRKPKSNSQKRRRGPKTMDTDQDQIPLLGGIRLS